MEMNKENMNGMVQDLAPETMEEVAGGYRRIGGGGPGDNGDLREQAEAYARLEEELARQSIQAAKADGLTLEQFIATIPVGNGGFTYNMRIKLITRLWNEV